MKKLLKSLTGAAIIGAVAGACIYFFTKKKEVEVSEDDFVDEDIIDVEDADVSEAGTRNYATLNSAPTETLGAVKDAVETPVDEEAVTEEKTCE